MTISLIQELKIFGIYDAGIPNLERVVLLANEEVDVGSFMLLLGLRMSADAVPLRDNMLWFGQAKLNRGDWIFVYTASGETRIDELPGTTSKLYSIHWGRTTTVFQNPHITPVLIRMDGVQIPESLPALAHGQEAGT